MHASTFLDCAVQFKPMEEKKKKVNIYEGHKYITFNVEIHNLCMIQGIKK